MLQYTADIERKIKIVKEAVQNNRQFEIIASGLYGSMLRGYADPNSDLDICFLVRRPVAEYLEIGENRKEMKDREEARHENYMELSKTITRLTGIPVMVAIVDVKDLLVGLINNNVFSLCVYEYFKQDNPEVEEMIGDAIKTYYHNSNVVMRTGNTIRNSLANAALDANSPNNVAYKQERAYLSTLWHCHRLLALMDGDTVIARTLKDLIDINKKNWAEKVPILFSSGVVGVYKSRINRNHFELPVVLNGLDLTTLRQGANEVLTIASRWLSKNPVKTTTAFDKAGTVLDFYEYLYTLEEKVKN